MSIPTPPAPGPQGPGHECFDCGSSCKTCWRLTSDNQWVHKGDPWTCRCPACPISRSPIPNELPPPVQ
jgi:hypothetical protein